jgi:protocatechuate 3,4-dioxygenase beta subunit
MRMLGVVVGLVWLAHASVPAQQAAIVLQGQVLVDANGQALPRARVTLGAIARTQVSALSDDTGRFRLTLPADGPAGQRITIAKAGFATFATTVTLQEFADGTPLTIRLQRSVAVSGRVVDRQGHPVTSALVAVRPAPLVAPRPGSSHTPATLTETDDLGEFRVGGLAEGRYGVAVVDGPSPSPARLDRLNAQLAGGADPDTAIPQATSASVFVALQAGNDVEGVVLTTRGPTQMPGLCPATPAAPGEGTGTIGGRVFNQRGEPVMCASVRLLNRGLSPVVATDADGRFEFTGLPAGRYGLETTKVLHLTSRYGSDRSRAPSTQIALTQGRALTNLELVLPTGSAVTGTVVDEAGEPVAGVVIRALKPRGSGELRFAVSPFGTQAQRTDDRGRFRLFGLLPGTYFIAASMDGVMGLAQMIDGWPPTFYPGTADVASAAAVRVDAGRDLSGIDITLGRPPKARLTGFAFDATGQPARGTMLLSGSHRSNALLLEPRTAAIGPDGAFAFSGVPPGDYVVQVTTAPPGDNALAFSELQRGFHFGMAYVLVGDADPPPVTIRTGRGSVLEGRVVTESGEPSTMSIMALPTDFDRSPIIGMGMAGLTFRSDGTFLLEGITGPRRIVKQVGPEESYIKSATVNGRDALDTPFDFGLAGEAFRDVQVVVGHDGAAVSGQVVDARQIPVEDYIVRLFSTDPAQWFSRSQRLKSAQPRTNGQFRITGVPPGDYWLVATAGSDDPSAGSDSPEPMELEALTSRAQHITLTSSGQRQITLTLGGR